MTHILLCHRPFQAGDPIRQGLTAAVFDTLGVRVRNSTVAEDRLVSRTESTRGQDHVMILRS